MFISKRFWAAAKITENKTTINEINPKIDLGLATLIL
jgi:hypothetical protein